MAFKKLVSVLAAALCACTSPPAPSQQAPPSPNPTASPSDEAVTPASSATEPVASSPAKHVCQGASEPEPCKNDRVRKGKLQDVEPCLMIMEPLVSGQGDASAFARTVRDQGEELWQCISEGGKADLSQSGKVMTARVITEPNQPARASFVASDLSPNAKRCMEQVLGKIGWPANKSTAEVTLRMVVRTRQWVDDPGGGCGPD